MPFFADLPACRRTLGLAGFSSHLHMCSKCTLTKQKINLVDHHLLHKRCNVHHQRTAFQARDASDFASCQRIFKSEGVRYSKLCELEYWSLIDDHVIDPMHNLLLGALAWHCKRFWQMTDADNIKTHPPADEALTLIQDATHPPELRPPSPTPSNSGPPAASVDPPIFSLNISLQSTEPDDSSFQPPDKPEYDAPITGAIFDRALLLYVNQRLPRIMIPTCISRAIPVLGQASYGTLKADNWRNLFTIQLPLCLIPLWNSKDSYTTKLLNNFADLVSMVNLALKRKMSADIIAKYRKHNRAYLESSLGLFPDRPLAPNHHMSLHIPDSLERFGPVRAWWTFPFERLMGQVIKTCHNNRIGLSSSLMCHCIVINSDCIQPHRPAGDNFSHHLPAFC
ncbi:hypothetical protein PTTG_05486 [Puccinia triticina 1-1 BBBD Race 1]|uniref:DUF4218 domain-containing protein n=1 Tax=Puccinia triticina (isolate 1-1 / race 1 (BBBD)) TaxID=630390 RepID=A0A0C4EXD8_PUCT1|nr:hypothetical protein PTTG_05486 [Puccinia triticina 1-1 BBBD Race 1]